MGGAPGTRVYNRVVFFIHRISTPNNNFLKDSLPGRKLLLKQDADGRTRESLGSLVNSWIVSRTLRNDFLEFLDQDQTDVLYPASDRKRPSRGEPFLPQSLPTGQ